jgi:hypothetical protein
LHTLSRRALLVRAGALGASALTLPALLACGATSTLAGVLGPTATPTAGEVSAGTATVQWALTQRAAQHTTAAQLAAQAQGYGSQLVAAYATSLQQLTTDLQVVGKLTDQYDTPLQAALTQVGVDISQLQADLQAFGKLTDPQQLAASAKDLDAKYLAQFAKANSAAGIDRDTIVAGLAQQIRPQGNNLKLVTVTTDGIVISYGWNFNGGTGSPGGTGGTPPLGGCGVYPTFTPPYDLWAGTGGGPRHVDAQTGRLNLANNTAFAGSAQQLGSVGVTVPVDHTITALHVEAVITIAGGQTAAVATPGYASSEVILHLQLLNGATVLAEQRQSLARSVGAVFSWDTKNIAAGPLRLALDYARPGGAPTDVNLSAIVEAETWVGAGAFGGATAFLDCTVNQIAITNAC